MTGAAGGTSQILFFVVSGSEIKDPSDFHTAFSLLRRFDFDFGRCLSLQDPLNLIKAWPFALVLI